MIYILFTALTTTIDGPLSVWNGQEELASITNDAGEWPHGEQGGLLQNMFDGNLETFWHSSGATVNDAKTIKIEFKVNNFGCFSETVSESIWFLKMLLTVAFMYERPF